MASNLLTSKVLAREALMRFTNSLTLTKLIDRSWEDQFAKKGAKIGDTLNIPDPVRFQGRTGSVANFEDVVETSVPLVIGEPIGVDFPFDNRDLTLSVDRFADKYITSATSQLANMVDVIVASQFSSIPNAVGTPGSPINDIATYLSAGVALDNNSAPQDGDRYAVITPLMGATGVKAFSGLYNPQTTLGEQYVKGFLMDSLGFKIYKDQNLQTFKTGAQGGAPVVSGANQTGSVLATSGWTASTKVLNQGDIITLASVDAVNPMSKNDVMLPRQFVVTADVTSNSSGQANVNIYPPIIPAAGATLTTTFGASPVFFGPAYQNVTATPANGASISIFGAANTSTPQGLAFHKKAITMAFVELDKPGAMEMSEVVTDDELGISMRFVRGYDLTNNRHLSRLDVMLGIAVVRPEWAVRLAA